MSYRLAALITVLCLAGPALVSGANTPAKADPRLPTRVSFIDAPSGEKPAAREKRLKRECKGRPNAGMCLGHTR